MSVRAGVRRVLGRIGAGRAPRGGGCTRSARQRRIVVVQAFNRHHLRRIRQVATLLRRHPSPENQHPLKNALRKSKKSCESVNPDRFRSATPVKNAVRKSKKSWELTKPSRFQSAVQYGVVP